MTRASSFEAFIAAGEPFDLLRGVSLLARDEQPSLDPVEIEAQVDALAQPLLAKNLSAETAAHQAEALRCHLFVDLGFHGNEADYYAPENSLISAVLARRTGIPISLAVVYCEVAQRAGIRASGVAFPGHFIVRIDDAGGSVALVDPFFGGRALDDVGLAALEQRVTAQGAMPRRPSSSLAPELLVAASSRSVLLRWLMNLRGVHLQRGDFARALVALDRIVTLVPTDASALRDRGLLAARLGAVEQGRADLTRAGECATDPALAARIRADLVKLGTKPASVH